VQVAASINFDKVERTVQAVDPDRQALATEQKAEVTPSSPEQGAGYSTTATSYENTRSVESFSGAIGNVKKLTVAVLIADKVTVPLSGSDAVAPTAPLVTPRSTEELSRIESLVKNALGVDSLRGDMISVVSAPFDMPQLSVAVADSVTAPTDLITQIQANPKPVIALAALVVLLIIGLAAVFLLRPGKSKQLNAGVAPDALPPAPQYAELPASTQMQTALQGVQQLPEYTGEPIDQMAALEEQRRQIVLPPPPTTPEREQAIATVDQRPEAALRVTRNWLRQ
jgi:flagellar M-ring protein FliF